MLKKLKKKFVGISMAAVFFVLFIIMGTINILNYENTKQGADQILNILEKNEGSFPHKEPDMQPKNTMEPQAEPKKEPMSPETPFNTRYFTVTLAADGTVDTNVQNIAAISSDTAIEYATNLYQKNKSKGYQGNYRYRKITTTDNQTMYIFVDCDRELNSFHNFLLASLFISVLGLIGIFILLLLFSPHAVRPIVESYEKQKQFITDASHEIKTPLAVINANTDVIEMENGESQWTDSTKKQIERLTSLTEKLVILSKMDEEQPDIAFSPVNVSALLNDVIDSFEAVCVTKNIYTSIAIEPDLIVTGNEDSLRRLFTLLMDNAIKYTKDSIRVTLQKKKHTAVFIFENTIEDMEPGRHPELFERFYRPDSSRNTKTGGFGIGLATAKAITEAHKGKITAKCPNRQVIQFLLTFPMKNK